MAFDVHVAAAAFTDDAPARARSAPPIRVDLDAAPTPPTLPDRHGAAALAEELGREVESIRKRAPSDAASMLATDASVTYRMIARELLARGDGSTTHPHAIVLAGFRLADARGDFDVAMGRASALATDRVRAAIERFRDNGLGAVRAAPPEALLAVVRSEIAGLSPALDAAAVPARADHWPLLPRPESATSPAQIAPDATRPALPRTTDSWAERVRATTDGVAVDAALAQALRALVEQLARAEAWPDLEPEVAELAQALLPLVEQSQQMAAATWLAQSQRDAWLQRVVDAVARCTDATTRAEALRQLEQLGAVAHTVHAGTRLVRPRQQTSSRGPIDPTRVARTIDALATPASDASAHRRIMDRLSMVLTLLDTMFEVRRLEEAEVRRDLRTLRRQLARDAMKTEDSVLRQIESLAAPDASPVDPACSSLLESQRRRIRALRVLDAVDRAMAEIEARSVSQGAALNTRLRTTLAQLGEPARTESALLVLERFVDQWSVLRELPAEAAIRAGDSAATDRCAGRSLALLAEIDRRRVAWAAGWASGQPDEAWKRAGELLVILSLIDDSAALARTSAQPRLIGRWGGWDDLGGVPGSTHAMDGRLAVAIEALSRQDERAIADATALLTSESPLWRLRARVLRRLGPALEPLPEGLAGALGRAVGEPAPRAFMASRSEDLAALARFSRELLFAQSVRDEEQRVAIERFLSVMATSLLRDLDAPSSTPRHASTK